MVVMVMMVVKTIVSFDAWVWDAPLEPAKNLGWKNEVVWATLEPVKSPKR
jgi:hypothetical protein